MGQPGKVRVRDEGVSPRGAGRGPASRAACTDFHPHFQPAARNFDIIAFCCMFGDLAEGSTRRDGDPAGVPGCQVRPTRGFGEKRGFCILPSRRRVGGGSNASVQSSGVRAGNKEPGRLGAHVDDVALVPGRDPPDPERAAPSLLPPVRCSLLPQLCLLRFGFHALCLHL